MAKGFNFRGFLAGMASSATFGMLPLFTVPVMAVGLSVNNILCYRMFIVSIAMAILMLIKRIPFHISLKALGWCMVLGLCYYGSATLLFQGYATMSTGVATTLHFLYPVFVTLIMAFVFKQRTSPFTIVAIILALTGICLLSIGRGGRYRQCHSCQHRNGATLWACIRSVYCVCKQCTGTPPSQQHQVGILRVDV